MQQELQTLKEHSNLRRLPQLTHEGRTVVADGRHMLNLSSNDYLGLAADRQLKEEFLQTLTPDTFLPTSSSSRLLTGNFGIYEELETELATLFGTETALVLNSGYHANMGILPAVSDAQTLILADKLVHASIIDGIRLSTARCIRFRHNDLVQLERLLEQHHAVLFPFSGCKCRKNNFITVMVMHEKAAQMQLLRGSSLSNVVGFHSLDDW